MCLVCQTRGFRPEHQTPSDAVYPQQALLHQALSAPIAVAQITYATSIPQSALVGIAGQLIQGYWESRNQEWARFAIPSGGAIGVDISGLTSAAQATALLALDSWTQTTGIKFDTSGQTNVQITIDDGYNGAFSWRSLTGHVTQSAQVNIAANWTQVYGGDVGSYGFQTFVHEIGHALGLGHAGDYNGSAIYDRDAEFALDSWQTSVMSYFSQSQNRSTGASYAYLGGPMQADIMAAQWLYGASTLVNAGNTTFGVGSTAGAVQQRIGDMMADGTLPVPLSFTVVDRAGHDSFNFSTDRQNQAINLTPGSASSIYGLTGNVLIERLTLIERVLAGQGNDTVQGNSADNTVFGNQGQDRINGAGGNDRIFGGDGNDFLFGASGRNSLLGGNGQDRLVSSTGHDVLTGGQGADIFVFAGPGVGPMPDRDVITDFVRGVDRISLTGLGPAGAKFQILDGSSAFGVPYLTLTPTAGGILVRAEWTGDGVPDFEIFVNNLGRLSAMDFLL